MELRQLRYFVTLARLLHFRRAAEELHITQPPLSQTIKQLEAEIGALLLERGRKQVVKLTPAGEAFYDHAQQILERVEHAKNHALGISRGETGILSIAHTDDYINSFLADFLVQFSEHYQGVMLQYTQESSLAMDRRLVDGELDCIFTTAPLSARIAECEHLYLKPTPIVLVMPATHRLAHLKKVRLDQTVRERHIYAVGGTPTAFDSTLSAALNKAGISLDKHMQPVISTLVALQMVQSGYGVMFATLGSVPQISDISIVPIDQKDMSLRRALVWRKENNNPTLRALLNFLQNTSSDYLE